MFSTGPMFLTVQYSMFPNRADVGVIPADVYGAPSVGGGCSGQLLCSLLIESKAPG